MKQESLVERLHLRIHPDSALRQVCEPVERFDSWLNDILEEMFLLMQVNNGIGLAGPQVGIPLRLFIAKNRGREICIVNPTIASRSGSVRRPESCLSLPDTLVNVRRNFHIDVHGYDFRGQRMAYQFQGLWARVVQHEVDHLNGILISDYQNN